MATAEQQAVLKTLLVSDLVGSTRLVEELGDRAAADLGQRLDRLARDLMVAHQGLEIDKTDGFLLLFDRPLAALHYALEYHAALRRLSDDDGRRIEARVGIHLGEVVVRENSPGDVERGAKPLEVEGLAKPTTGRLMSLAWGGQTLLTRGAFDLARRSAVGILDDELSWIAHGAYRFEGVGEPVEVFEVGAEGLAPLKPPADSEKARRVVEQVTIPGWRPAPGHAVPGRRNWLLEQKLGEGGFGEAWLAIHQKTRDPRVFKFCHDALSLQTLQREITIFRLLRGELGDRDDIIRIVDWRFDEPPYFVESEYAEGGNFAEWAEEQGGIEKVPLATRLEVVAQVATALAAAHSVGVLHKDVKPANVLIASGRDGEPRARLCDFGVGAVTEAKRLARAGITVLGMADRGSASPTPTSHGGTRLYMAPEVLEGKPATVQADIYALGLILYQAVVGDFSRALAPGWRRDVADELLCEDIAFAVDGAPEQRLGNALRLAERLRDLDHRRRQRAAERHQQQEQARLRDRLERNRKRRRIWSAVAVVLALFAGAMTVMVFRVRDEAERAERETVRAQREAVRADRAAMFLAELLEVADPQGTAAPGAARGTSMTVRELVDRGRDKLRTGLVDDPRTRARLMETLGGVYRSLGHPDDARPLLEEALALRRQVHGDQHPAVAGSLNTLAVMFYAQGDYEAAEPRFRESLQIRRRLFGDEHSEVATSLSNLALLLRARGDYAAAEPLFRESLAMKRRLLGDDHLDVAIGLHRLARLLQTRGDLAGAEPLFRESLAMKRRLMGDDHHQVAVSLNNLAKLLHARGDQAEAEQLIGEVLEIYRQGLPPGHWRIANAESIRGSVLAAGGRYREAEPQLVASYPVVRDAKGERSLYAREALERLVTLYDAWGRPEKAAEYRALWIAAGGG